MPPAARIPLVGAWGRGVRGVESSGTAVMRHNDDTMTEIGGQGARTAGSDDCGDDLGSKPAGSALRPGPSPKGTAFEVGGKLQAFRATCAALGGFRRSQGWRLDSPIQRSEAAPATIPPRPRAGPLPRVLLRPPPSPAPSRAQGRLAIHQPVHAGGSHRAVTSAGGGLPPPRSGPRP